MAVQPPNPETSGPSWVLPSPKPACDFCFQNGSYTPLAPPFHEPEPHSDICQRTIGCLSSLSLLVAAAPPKWWGSFGAQEVGARVARSRGSCWLPPNPAPCFTPLPCSGTSGVETTKLIHSPRQGVIGPPAPSSPGFLWGSHGSPSPAHAQHFAPCVLLFVSGVSSWGFISSLESLAPHLKSNTSLC